MIPINEFPQTYNGKRDYGVLRKTAIKYMSELLSDNQDENSGFTTLEEKEMAEIWKGIINCSNINVNDNFFSLGGNSIKALQLVNKVNDKFHVQLTIKDIFEFSTISEMTKLIEGKGRKCENEYENDEI